MRHTIGIRREDKNEWERRVPIVPDDMYELIRDQGLSFKVQPSMLRIFPDQEFESAGAVMEEDLSDCPVVFAVKEIPLDFYREGTTYIFFSHTVKGQPYNMDMLRHILKRKCNIIDYERIVDDRNRRLIFFGRHAGLAGMVDTLWCLGERLDMEGVDPNPLGAIRQTYHYESLEAVLAHMGEVGDRIRDHGFAPNQTPFVIGFAGYGNVSQGAQEILEPFPVESLAPEELAPFYEKGGHDPCKIYKVVFREEHLVKPKQEDAAFALQEYYDHPERYVSSFDQFLPYMNVLVNCIYWDTPYPRLITKASIKSLYAAPEPPRLKVVGDISCDIEGSIEFTLKATEPDNPVFVYNPEKDTMADGVAGKGPVVMSVDNLPCELSRESSEHFSKTLLPFLPAMAAADYTVPFEKLALPPEIKRALIVHQGKFTPDYTFMEKFLK